MKYLLLTAVLLAGLAGCGKKADPTPDYSPLIRGKWVTVNVTTELTQDGKSTTYNTDFLYGERSEIFTADTVKFYTSGALLTTPRHYTLSGRTYTAYDSFSGAPATVEIVSLDANKFVRRVVGRNGNRISVSTDTCVR